MSEEKQNTGSEEHIIPVRKGGESMPQVQPVSVSPVTPEEHPIVAPAPEPDFLSELDEGANTGEPVQDSVVSEPDPKEAHSMPTYLAARSHRWARGVALGFASVLAVVAAVFLINIFRHQSQHAITPVSGVNVPDTTTGKEQKTLDYTLSVNGQLKVLDDSSLETLTVSGPASFAGSIKSVSIDTQGVSVTGNAVVTGDLQAGNLRGNGSGLNNVNASTFGGFGVDYFLGLISDAAAQPAPNADVALRSAANTFTAGNTFNLNTIFNNGLTVQGSLSGQSAVFSTSVDALQITQNGNVVCDMSGNCGTGSTIAGSGTVGTIAVFTGTQAVGNSLLSQSGSTVTVAGTLAATALQGSGAAITSLNGNNIASGLVGVGVGGTGRNNFVSNGVVYGNGTGVLQVTAAGATGECFVGNTSAAPSWYTCSVAAAGATPGGAATGDLSGSYPNPTVVKLNGVALSIGGLAAGQVLTYDGTYWSNSSGTGNFILNQSASAQAANLFVQGVTGTVTAVFKAESGSNTDIVRYTSSSGSTVAKVNSGGDMFTNVNMGIGTLSVFDAGRLSISASTNKGIVIRSAQAADYMQFRSSNGGTLFTGFNTSGQMYYQSGSFTGTLVAATLTGNHTYSLPDATGTLALTNDTSNFVRNQTGQQASSNFNISGIGIAAILQAGTLDVASAAALNIGTTNATGINLNQNVTVAAGKSIALSNASGSGAILSSRVTGDANDRLQILADGSINFGLGTNPTDVTLAHAGGSGILALTGSQTISSVLAINTSTGSGQFAVKTGGAGTIGAIVIAGSTTQTANLQEYRSTYGSVYSGVTSGGGLFTTGTNNTFTGLASPVISTASTGTNFYYEVSATNDLGETLPSAPVGMATNNVAISWPAVAGATRYKIFRSTSTTFGASTLLAYPVPSAWISCNNGGTCTYTDTGTATNAGTPLTSTTGTGVTIQGWTGQSGNVFSAGANTGVNFSVGGNGGVAVASTNNSVATFTISNKVGQTSNLFQLIDTSNNVLTKFDASGNLTLGSVPATAGTTTVSSNTLTFQGSRYTGGAATTDSFVMQLEESAPGSAGNLTITGSSNLFTLSRQGKLGLGGATSPGATLTVKTINGSTTPTVNIQAVSSQSTDLLQFLANGGSTYSGFNPTGQLYYQSGSFTGTVVSATLTANRTYTLPDEGGTLCVQNSVNCGFASSSGSNSYIQNQNAGAQTSSNFWISGTGRANIIQGARIAFDTGTAGAPGIFINGDSNTGIYSAGADTIAFTAGGTAVASFASASMTIHQAATFNAGLTVSGAVTNINDNSNFATNINTGTSTGAVNIGSSTSGAINIQSASLIGLNNATIQIGSGSGGTATIRTQGSVTNTTNAISLNSGDSAGANQFTGAANLFSGNGTGTNTSSGNVNIYTGTATGTQGSVIIQGTSGKVAIGTGSTSSSLLTIGGNTTTSAGGIAFGSDANATLFRAASDTLKAGGAFITGGNLSVDGNTFNTSQTTFNLLNSNVTTINFAGAATTIDVGAATGMTTINNALRATGATTLNGGATITAGTGVALTVQGVSGQNIAEFKNSGGTTVATITQLGNFLGNGGTFAASTAGSGTDFTTNVTSTNTSATAVTLNAQQIGLTGTNNANVGANTLNGIKFANVAAATNNTFNGLNFGTGYTTILNYNGSQLISGGGKIQNAALDSTINYSNLQNLTNLTVSGTLTVTTAAVFNGTLTATTATFNGNLTVNGHIVTGNASGTTTAAIVYACGTGSSVTVTGNDTSGYITLNSGNNCDGTTPEVIITFANAYASAPNIVLTPATEGSAMTSEYVGSATTTTFTLKTYYANFGMSQTYKWYYQVMQ